MKKSLLMVGLFTLTIFANAQQPEYKVVFDMTSSDTLNQQSLVRMMGFIRESNPNAKMEVVMYGQGLYFVLKGKSNQEAGVEKLLTDKGISFKVCSAAMKRLNIEKEQLLPGVIVVPDGVFEIITKQKEGWGYIKVSR